MWLSSQLKMFGCLRCSGSWLWAACSSDTQRTKLEASAIIKSVVYIFIFDASIGDCGLHSLVSASIDAAVSILA